MAPRTRTGSREIDYFDRYAYLQDAITSLAERIACMGDHGFGRTKSEMVANIADILKRTRDRAADTTMCFDNCKNLYFCCLPRGHKGDHIDDYGLTWPRNRSRHARVR